MTTPTGTDSPALPSSVSCSPAGRASRPTPKPVPDPAPCATTEPTPSATTRGPTSPTLPNAVPANSSTSPPAPLRKRLSGGWLGQPVRAMNSARLTDKTVTSSRFPRHGLRRAECVETRTSGSGAATVLGPGVSCCWPRPQAPTSRRVPRCRPVWCRRVPGSPAGRRPGVKSADAPIPREAPRAQEA